MSFEEIFYKYYKDIVRYIFSIVKNQAIAEELPQEVFIKLYNYGYENISYHKAFLYKTAIFLSYNHLRAESIHKKKIDSMDIKAIEQEPDKIYIEKENQNEINKVLNKMQDKEKTILELKYKGLKYKEISEIMKININSVGKTLARAREKFYDLYIKDRR